MYFSISLIYYYSKDATKYDAKCYLNLFQLHFFSGLRKLSEKGSYQTLSSCIILCLLISVCDIRKKCIYNETAKANSKNGKQQETKQEKKVL